MKGKKAQVVQDTEKNSVKLTVEQWDIEMLIPYARNPRKNDEQVDRMTAALEGDGRDFQTIEQERERENERE